MYQQANDLLHSNEKTQRDLFKRKIKTIKKKKKRVKMINFAEPIKEETQTTIEKESNE